MKFISTVCFILTFSVYNHAQISKADRDTLFANLKLLEKEWVQSAVAPASINTGNNCSGMAG